MKDLEALQARVANLPKELTKSIGFELPEHLDYDSAIVVLNGVNEPLRTQIMTEIVTEAWDSAKAENGGDYSWVVCGNIVKRLVLFGELDETLRGVADNFRDALDSTADRLYEVLQNTDVMLPTHYDMLSRCVCTLKYLMDDYRPNATPLTAENYSTYLPGDRYENRKNGELLSSLVSEINEMKNWMCVSDKELPYVVRGFNWVSNGKTLRNCHSELTARVKAIAVFNDVLNKFIAE